MTTDPLPTAGARYALMVAGDGLIGSVAGLDVSVTNAASGEFIASVSIDWGPIPVTELPSFKLHWTPSAVDGPHWAATGHFGRSDRGLVIRDLSVVPAEDMDWAEDDEDLAGIPDGGLTVRVLRQIPLGAVYGSVRAILSATPDDPDFGWMHSMLASDTAVHLREAIERLREAGVGSALAARPHRDSNRPALLREVALAYIEEADQPGAHQRLAKRFGKSSATIRDWIHQAREQGWLAPGAKGRRGAMPGRLLIEEQDRVQHRIDRYGHFNDVDDLKSPGKLLVEMQEEITSDAQFKVRDVEVAMAAIHGSHRHQLVPRMRQWEEDYRATHDGADPFASKSGRAAYLTTVRRIIKDIHQDVLVALIRNEVEMSEDLWRHQREKHDAADIVVESESADG